MKNKKVILSEQQKESLVNEAVSLAEFIVQDMDNDLANFIKNRGKLFGTNNSSCIEVM